MTGRLSGSRTMSILPERGETSALDCRMSMKNHNTKQNTEIWRKRRTTHEIQNHLQSSPAGSDIGVLPPLQRDVDENADGSRGARTTRAVYPNTTHNDNVATHNDSAGSIEQQSSLQQSSLQSNSFSLAMGLSTPASRKFGQFSSNTAPGLAENHMPHRFDPASTPNGLKPRQSVHHLRSKVHSTLTAVRTSSPVTSIASSMEERNRFYNDRGDVKVNNNKTNQSRRSYHHSRCPESSDLPECNSNTPNNHSSIKSRHQYSRSLTCPQDPHPMDSNYNQNRSFECHTQQYTPRKPFMDILPNRNYNSSDSSHYSTRRDASSSTSILPNSNGGETMIRYESRADMRNSNHNPSWLQEMPTLTSSAESLSSSPQPERKLRDALISLASACNTPSSPVLTRSGVKTAVGATVVANSRREHCPGKYLPSVLPLPPLESAYEEELRRSVTHTGATSWQPSSSSSSTSSQYSQSHVHLRSSPRSSLAQSHYHGEQYHQSSFYLNRGYSDYKYNQTPSIKNNDNAHNANNLETVSSGESSSRLRLPLDASMDTNYPPLVERKSTDSNSALWKHNFDDNYVPLTAVGKLIQQLSLDQSKGGSGFAVMCPRDTNSNHHHRHHQQ